MSAARVIFQVGAGCLAIALAGGCSSSSSGGAVDSGHAVDSGKPQVDAAHEAGPTDARADGARGDGGPAEAAVDAPAACADLDASISGLTVQASCEQCIGQYCCAQAQACAATAGCKQIEECATACVAGGTTSRTCALECIEADAGYPEAGLSPKQTAAEELDLCLASHCNAFCG